MSSVGDHGTASLAELEEAEGVQHIMERQGRCNFYSVNSKIVISIRGLNHLYDTL